MYKGNKFKNIMGTHLLQALFYEQAIDTDRPDVLYTLKLEDHEGFPSLHRLYVELEDTSEYVFAKTYFDNWAHWKKLCACNWFKPYLEEMREELDLKLKQRALDRLKAIAEDPENKSHYLANKLIHEQGLSIKKDNRGRPSKTSVVEEANKLFKTSEEVNEDHNRIINFRPL